jgi:hypothetical protein
VLVAGLGWLRRSYGFNFWFDFVHYASYGFMPLLWLTSMNTGGMRPQATRFLVMLGSALLTCLVGTVLTNGLP